MGHFDENVIIVGAGPTGLMLAGELCLAGVRPVILERRTEPMQQSRALGFSARTIEEFHQRGLLPRFTQPATGPLTTIPIGHFGGLMIDYRVIEGGSYGARGVPQSVTERILTEWATGLGAELRRGHEVVGLASADDGVDLEVDTPAGRTRLRAAYVIGCDGGQSSIRKQAGIDFPGTSAAIEMWLADVTGVRLRPRFAGERVPGGMVMVLPMGPHVNRVVVYERDAKLRDTQDAPTFPEVADAWERLTGEDIHDAKPAWVSWFTDSSRQAAEYRKGRVFLAGDAAHIHLPIGGQGMSAGVQDAVNLGWKLAATIHGHAPADLLDTYHTERHPVGARVLANTLAQRLLYLSGDEMQPLRDVMAELLSHEEVQRHLVGMVTGLDTRYDVGGDEHPLLGRRVPERGLAGDTTIFAQLHRGRPVLFDFADDASVRAAAAPWSDRVDVVTAAMTGRIPPAAPPALGPPPGVGGPPPGVGGPPPGVGGPPPGVGGPPPGVGGPPAGGPPPAGPPPGVGGPPAGGPPPAGPPPFGRPVGDDAPDPLAGAAAMLVRPDGYIAWVGTPGSTDGLAAALTRWFGRA